MKLIKNTGSDRVIDELRQTLAPPSSLDLASPAFSLFAFGELRDLLEKLDGCADAVEPLALGIVEWHKQLAPAGETSVVFRDSAFADDVAMTNLTAMLQQHGLENVRSL